MRKSDLLTFVPAAGAFVAAAVIWIGSGGSGGAKGYSNFTPSRAASVTLTVARMPSTFGAILVSGGHRPDLLAPGPWTGTAYAARLSRRFPLSISVALKDAPRSGASLPGPKSAVSTEVVYLGYQPNHRASAIKPGQDVDLVTTWLHAFTRNGAEVTRG